MGTYGTEPYVIVLGKPIAKQRVKFGKGYAHTPKETVEHEELVMAEYLRQDGRMLHGPIVAEYEFVFEPPKSLSNKKRLALMGAPRLAKPDTDNLIKLVQDALNGIAYTDDNQIWMVTSQKVYGPEAMTIIRLREAE